MPGSCQGGVSLTSGLPRLRASVDRGVTTTPERHMLVKEIAGVGIWGTCAKLSHADRSVGGDRPGGAGSRGSPRGAGPRGDRWVARARTAPSASSTSCARAGATGSDARAGDQRRGGRGRPGRDRHHGQRRGRDRPRLPTSSPARSCISMANGLEKRGREFRCVVPRPRDRSPRRSRLPRPDAQVVAAFQHVPAAALGDLDRRARERRARRRRRRRRPQHRAGSGRQHPRPARLRRRLARTTPSASRAFAASLLTVNLRHKGEGDAPHRRGAAEAQAHDDPALRHRAARGRPVRSRADRAHVRVRHHALRLDPPRSRGHDTSPTTC